MTSESAGKGGLVLYRGWKETGTYVWSPFVTKLELRLRHAGVPYRTDIGSVRSAPKGKIPYIEIAANDCVADSTLIIKRLVQDGTVEDLNDELSPENRAYDIALRALLEDKLYFYHVSFRDPVLRDDF
jgi:glutathione S-transferase